MHIYHKALQSVAYPIEFPNAWFTNIGAADVPDEVHLSNPVSNSVFTYYSDCQVDHNVYWVAFGM